ncbi:MAG: type II toxin-antitoxin system VapC family toxin [Fimbriimonadaceae bacterium]|nr:type II toxin-antitoxin system VapC family toxin [Fimbriimonadaceae bacterium]
MSVAAHGLLVLDTSVLVHLVRHDGTGQAIDSDLGLSARHERPFYCVVTEGEIRALATGWAWGAAKLSKLDDLLLELVPVDIGSRDVIDSYSALYSAATKLGRPRGENDLWIAAAAMATGADLVTCDTDFDWMHPDWLVVHYFAEVR